jgi:predicted Zn-dependent peptidase
MEGTHSITLILILKGGAAWESRGQKGITHLVEHLCFRRRDGMNQEEFYYKIERLGAYLRGVTSRDRVLFELTVIPERLGAAADVLGSLFEENGWTREDIRREKEVVFRQLEDGNDYCLETMISDFFNHAPAGEPIAGSRKKLERLTRPQLEAHKAELFDSARCEIILTGPITPDHTRYARKRFSRLVKSASKKLADITPERFLAREARHDRLFTGEADKIKIGLTFDIDTSKITPIQAELTRGLLCDGLLTPFAARLREELGLLHEFQNNLEFYDFGGLLYFIFGAREDQAAQMMDEITGILARQRERLDKRAFECVGAAYTDGMAALFDSPRRFAYELAFDSGISTPQSYIERNRQITYEQLGETAREIFRSRNMIASINDVPLDQELMDRLYEKKELLRNTLPR